MAKRLINIARKLGLDLNKSYETNTEYSWDEIPGRGNILLDDIKQKVVFNSADFGFHYFMPMALVLPMEEYHDREK